MFGGPDLSTLFVTSASRGLTPDQLTQQPDAGGLFAIATDSHGIPETRFGGRF
jgi:sugar lactone lactonase YvrE